MILSGNSIEHALLALAAMYVGVPYAPIAPAYSLLAQRSQHAAAHLCERCGPGWSSRPTAPRSSARSRSLLAGGRRARRHASRPRTAAQTTRSPSSRRPTRRRRSTTRTQRVGPDTIAKILFTSGSTGTPKGVINTQRMLCSNQEMIRTVLPFLADEPPVLCDWLPWNHTFGGNHNFGLVLYNGGTLYIDDGQADAGRLRRHAANLREIATTAYFNVPRGYELLLPALRGRRRFRRALLQPAEACSSTPRPACGQEVADELAASSPSRRCGERDSVGHRPRRDRDARRSRSAPGRCRRHRPA